MEAWGALWLNPTGHPVLIKSVFSSLPLFHLSSLLAPAGFKKDMTQLIRKFLWYGGKSNSKKFPPLNNRGGLGIRDPELANIALVAKLLWRLFSRNKEWWKTTIVKKYKMGTRKRFIDQKNVNHNGSPTWKLLCSFIPHIKEKLTWIP